MWCHSENRLSAMIKAVTLLLFYVLREMFFHIALTGYLLSLGVLGWRICAVPQKFPFWVGVYICLAAAAGILYKRLSYGWFCFLAAAFAYANFVLLSMYGITD